MLSWFFKKRKATEPTDEVAQDAAAEQARAPQSTQSPEAARAIERWDASIADIESRFEEVLARARADSEAALGSLQADFGPLSRIWSAIEHQMHQHTEEISDSWDEISDQLSEIDDVSEEVIDREGNKRDLASCEIEIRYTRAYREEMARAAEALRQLGTVEASSLFVASGALFIGQRQAQQAWEAMTRAETRINLYRESRDVPMPLLEELESSARQYWTTLFSVEAEHVPDKQRHVADKIESRMKDVNRTLQQHWQWRQRNG
jgi:hypothetical protein